MRWFARVSAVLVVASLCLVSTASAATAVPPDRTPSSPSGLGTLPAGVACAFPVSLDLVGGDQGQLFTFFDRNGNVVREMGTARHSTWKFTNLDSGKSVTIQLPGGLERVTTAADGTTAVVIDGGAIGFNAPTDTPPGPFSFSNVGRLVLTIDANGNGTIVSLTGKRVDLCAAVGA